MRQSAWEKLQREWREDLPAVADGVDVRPYLQGWALGDELEDGETEWRPSSSITMMEVLRAVSHISGVPADFIRSPRQLQHITARRYIVIDLISRLCPQKTLGQIAEFMGRHHTTIMHAMRRMPEAIKDDPDLAAEYAECCRHFGLKP